MPAQMQTVAGGSDVIQYAFGANANLYSDVLSVPPDAPPTQIKSAFFDRRYELYEVLGRENELTPTERHFAEQRMDAIVAAYRILSNPSLRAEYDEKVATGTSNDGGGKAQAQGKAKAKSGSSDSPIKRSRSRSRSLLRKALNASPLSRSRSSNGGSAPADAANAGRGDSSSSDHGRRRAFSGLDDGELRLQQQLLQQTNGEVPTQQLNPNSRLSTHLDSHVPPPPSSPGRYDDQTISTLGMRGATTPQRPIRPVGILKNQGSDETDRTRPVESDNDDEEGYDFFKAYAANDDDNEEEVEDVEGSPIQQRRRRHHRDGSRHRRSSRSRSRRRYDSEEDETTVVDDETFIVKTLGCSALEPLDFFLRPARVFRACREEVTGAFDDTTSAFDQVCNVFTLRKSDISAVVGEIDGAKKEFSPDKKASSKARGKSGARDKNKSKNRERRRLSSRR